MRQLQADHVSEVTSKRVDVARLPGAGGSQPPKKVQAGDEGTTLELSGRWAQKLDKEKIEMQERKQQVEMKLQQLEMKLQQRAERQARKQQLRVEPQLLSGQLADRLQRWEHSTPRSPWKEQLARLLQEAPRRLSCKEEHGPVDRVSRMRREGQQQRLLAFLECCVLVDQLPLAHHVLVVRHSRSRQRRILTLPMYNTVLLGWARKVSGGVWRGQGERGHQLSQVEVRLGDETCLAVLRFQPLSFRSKVQVPYFTILIILLTLRDKNLMWPSKEVLNMTEKGGRNPAYILVHFLPVCWARASEPAWCKDIFGI